MSMIVSKIPGFSHEEHPKIVVVGAGLAGLTAAYRLAQKGMDVEVYEARERVGGRVLTASLCGNSIELGGQNIADGGRAFYMRQLIEEMGLKTRESQISLQSDFFDGEHRFSFSQLLQRAAFEPESLWKKLLDLRDTSSNMEEVMKGILNPEDLLYRAVASRMAGYEGETVNKLSPIYITTLYHILVGGVALAHSLDDKEVFSINLITIEGGNSRLTEDLGQFLGDRLHLNAPLKRIERNPNSTLKLFFGEVSITADILILAIPCSAYADIVFEEGVLPKERLEAITSIRYGANAKIIIPMVTCPTKRLSLIKDQSIAFLDADHKTLTLYLTGKHSSFTSDTLFDTYCNERSMLEIGFGRYYYPLINELEMAVDRSFAIYEKAVGYSWPNDPYAKGSYAYISPGQEEVFTRIENVGDEKAKALFTPVENIYFAGEHATILEEAPGTMEGACESGERITRMIIKRVF